MKFADSYVIFFFWFVWVFACRNVRFLKFRITKN